ncbi:invertase inhibitor [Striga asiatica]|uniref:Invertase inhibitor n=1 Tax=Striga asiatica TaxID=4170 RepID=A0A5A7PZI8_STRAF|nr:invertase inhibitor [Striga asiatica]
MKTPIIILYLALLSPAIVPATAKPPQNNQSLIESICKRTPNYRLCLTTIRADHTSAGSDVAGLGLILIRAVKSETNKALSAAARLVKTHPHLKAPLGKCADVYRAVIEADVPVAEQSIRGNPKFAENGMADVAVEADACERALGRATAAAAPETPMTAANRAVRDLAVVARAVIRNLL